MKTKLNEVVAIKRGRGRPKKVVAQEPRRLDVLQVLNLVAKWSKEDRKKILGALVTLDELEKAGWRYAKQ